MPVDSQSNVLVSESAPSLFGTLKKSWNTKNHRHQHSCGRPSAPCPHIAMATAQTLNITAIPSAAHISCLQLLHRHHQWGRHLLTTLPQLPYDCRHLLPWVCPPSPWDSNAVTVTAPAYSCRAIGVDCPTAAIISAKLYAVEETG